VIGAAVDANLAKPVSSSKASCVRKCSSWKAHKSTKNAQAITFSQNMSNQVANQYMRAREALPCIAGMNVLIKQLLGLMSKTGRCTSHSLGAACHQVSYISSAHK